MERPIDAPASVRGCAPMRLGERPLAAVSGLVGCAGSSRQAGARPRALEGQPQAELAAVRPGVLRERSGWPSALPAYVFKARIVRSRARLKFVAIAGAAGHPPASQASRGDRAGPPGRG